MYADLEAMEKDVQAEVQHSVDFAEAGAWEPVADLLNDVYTPGKVLSSHPSLPKSMGSKRA